MRASRSLYCQSFLGLKDYFAILYLVAASGALATLFGGESNEGGVFVILWGCLYFFTGIAFVSSSKVFFSKNEVVLYFLMLVVLASFVWSAMPKSTFSYSISICANLFFAAYCSRFFSINYFLGLLQVALNLMILLGLVFALAGFDFAFYYDPLSRSNLLGVSLVKGLFSHKIYAGFYAAIAFVLNLSLAKGARRVVWSGVSLLGVVLSGSSLGLVALIAGFSILIGLKSMVGEKTRRNFLVPIFALILVTVAIALALYEELLGLLGRDASLTGRTDLWAWAVEFWSKKPLFGWGYAGIFGDSLEAPARVINDDAYYQAPHFHSGYLQVLAELGLVGFSLYLYMLFYALKGAVRLFWSQKLMAYAAAASALILVVIVGTSMNIFLRYNELSSILVIFLYLAVKRSKDRKSILKRS